MLIIFLCTYQGMRKPHAGCGDRAAATGHHLRRNSVSNGRLNTLDIAASRDTLSQGEPPVHTLSTSTPLMTRSACLAKSGT